MIRTITFLALLSLATSGCLLRTHEVKPRTFAGPLKEATAQELIARVNSEAAKVKTLNATVDIATSSGGEKKGKVTDFQEIRGYVLVRKPSELRMVGLFPVVRNRMFDMVSDGENFKLSIPPKNKFIVGSKDVKVPSKQPLENLRPQHIFDALLLRAIDPKDEIAVLENSIETAKDAKTKKEVDVPNYVLDVIRRGVDGTWLLSRKIIFSRIDLLPRRQVLYDAKGAVVTIASYDNFTDHGGMTFPNIIEIQRPQEEYTIQLGIVKLKLNDPLKDAQFELAQPAGSQLQRLDQVQQPAQNQTQQPPVTGAAKSQR